MDKIRKANNAEKPMLVTVLSVSTLVSFYRSQSNQFLIHFTLHIIIKHFRHSSTILSSNPSFSVTPFHHRLLLVSSADCRRGLTDCFPDFYAN